MTRFIYALALSVLLNSVARAGQYSGKELQQAAPACPEWYSDNEWNVNVWGTYVFTNTDYNPNLDVFDLVVSTTEGQTVQGSFDKYIGNDHAWGGGADIKYFFHRYFGIGIEGFALDAHKRGFVIDIEPGTGIDITRNTDNHRAVGAVLGTFTLRYPIPCSRFAPYAWAGVGAIFGGGESDQVHASTVERALPEQGDGELFEARSEHFEGDTKLMGHFGIGLETRFTRHIGWTNDVSWGVIDGPKNNFTMIRSGLNFAF